MQEFLNVATQKFSVPLASSDVKFYFKQVLLPLCEVYPSSTLYTDALDIKENHKFSFYDSLILAAALSAHCKVLYSEDLQDGRRIGSMVIRNPFNSLN